MNTIDSKPLTYKDLFESLKSLTENQLNMTVTVLIADESHAIYDTCLLSEHPKKDELGSLFDDDIPLMTDHVIEIPYQNE